MIRDLALESERAVYSIQQLSNLISKPKSIAKVYASRLVKKGLAKRLTRGKISFVEDDYVIATQLIEPSYVSLSSALLFHGLIQQVPAAVQSVTPTNSRKYEKLGLVYHKIAAALFFGYLRYKKGSSYVFIAEPEKALLDLVYFTPPRKEMISEIIGKLDKKKLEDYVGRFRGRGRNKLKRWLA
jgi:predicted transcriptional regulator of viral defense system